MFEKLLPSTPLSSHVSFSIWVL